MEDKKPLEKLGYAIFFVALVFWGVSQFIDNRSGKGSSNTYNPPPVPPTPMFEGVKVIFEVLGLAGIIKDANADGSVNVNPSKNDIVAQTSVEKFYPNDFVEKNNIKTHDDVSEFDKKARKIVDDCTRKIIKSGESNYIAMREKRAICLKNAGYSRNDMLYMNAKNANLKRL